MQSGVRIDVRLFMWADSPFVFVLCLLGSLLNSLLDSLLDSF